MSWQTPENLSADGIAALFGFGSAAAMQSALEAAEDEAAKAGWTKVRLNKVADQGGISASPQLCTWTSSSLIAATISSNEITLEQAGEYDCVVSLQGTSMDSNTMFYISLEDWTSGSALTLQLGINIGGTQPPTICVWRGSLAANTKLRVYAFVQSGTGTIDGDGSATLVAGGNCFAEFRRIA